LSCKEGDEIMRIETFTRMSHRRISTYKNRSADAQNVKLDEVAYNSAYNVSYI